jgi:Holliday junction resolvasome RuvABC endonuclease subunit
MTERVMVTGLDGSLTSTGWARDGKTGRILGPIQEHANYMQKVVRLNKLVVAIDRICKGSEVVVMEGYSHASKYGGEWMGELGGAIKLVLYRRRIPFVVIPPSTMKKYATDNGRASKDQVLAAAVRQGAPVENNDEADAWWLYDMGLAHYEQHDFIGPQYRRKVLQSIRWPQLDRRETASA